VKAGVILGTPASLLGILGFIWLVLPAPTADIEVQANFRKVDRTLVQGAGEGFLDFEPANFWLKKDRMLVYFIADNQKTLIDVLFPIDLNKVRIAEIAPEKFYVSIYPYREYSNYVEYRLSLYDLKDGMKTSTVLLKCTEQSFSTGTFDVTNIRFDRDKLELGFDLVSECSSISNSVGRNIDFQQYRDLSGRVFVALDQSLVVQAITTAAANLEEVKRKADSEAETERLNNCQQSTLSQAERQYGERGGWLGNCTNYDLDPPGRAEGRVSGKVLYFNGLVDEDEPDNFAYSTEFVYVSCDLTSAYQIDISDDGQSMTLFCPHSTDGYENGDWVSVGQSVGISHYQQSAERADFKIDCDCIGLVFRELRMDVEARRVSFELGADADTISVNGTPQKLGLLPVDHKKGEPFNWGRFELVLTEGGLVQSFGPVV